MKTKYSFSFILLILLTIPSTMLASGKDWKLYGEEIKLKKVTPIKDAYKKPNKYWKNEILIEGVVGAVCQNKGCWMEVGVGKNVMRVKFEGYSFFVPHDSKGKKVKMQGRVKYETVDEETLKHWAEEAGKSKKEIEKIKGKQKVVMFIATGVLMQGGGEISQEQKDIIEGKVKKDEHEGHGHH